MCGYIYIIEPATIFNIVVREVEFEPPPCRDVKNILQPFFIGFDFILLQYASMALSLDSGNTTIRR